MNSHQIRKPIERQSVMAAISRRLGITPSEATCDAECAAVPDPWRDICVQECYARYRSIV